MITKINDQQLARLTAEYANMTGKQLAECQKALFEEQHNLELLETELGELGHDEEVALTDLNKAREWLTKPVTTGSGEAAKRIRILRYNVARKKSRLDAELRQRHYKSAHKQVAEHFLDNADLFKKAVEAAEENKALAGQLGVGTMAPLMQMHELERQVRYAEQFIG